MALADGSARAVPIADLDPARAVERPFGAITIPPDTTIDGLSERDWRRAHNLLSVRSPHLRARGSC